MEPKQILIQSSKCQLVLGLSDLYLELNLAASYRFPDKTLVRLHSVVGLREEVYVFATFTDQVPFGDTFRRHLGLVGPGTLPGPWTRLDGGFLSNISTIYLARVNGQPFTSVPEEHFALLLEFLEQDG